MSMLPLGQADDARADLDATTGSGLSVTPTGFASQAAEHAELPLNLNDLLCPSPTTTYYFRAAGMVATDVAISDGDILVVDRSVRLRIGTLVVCAEEDGFAVRRIGVVAGQVALLTADPTLPPLLVADEMTIFGAVTYVVHQVPQGTGQVLP